MVSLCEDIVIDEVALFFDDISQLGEEFIGEIFHHLDVLHKLAVKIHFNLGF
jgi:hypothetical protein